MMKPLTLLFVLACFLGFETAHALVSPYQDGDIIFQESQSQQSKAIREATDSRWSHVGLLFTNGKSWYVAEAVQPVRLTPLSSFIARGRNKDYRVYRVPGLTKSQLKKLRTHVGGYLGEDYDIYFEWSEELIYCSELVYKTYFKSTGIEIGKVQQFRDLKTDGPHVQALIRRRLEDKGETLDLDELIVTPASQVQDPKLQLIEKSEK